MSANSHPVIVCERAGHWAAAIRRAFAAAPRALDDADLRIVEVGTVEGCRHALSRWPAAVVVIELGSAGCDETLALVDWVEERCPAALAVVVAERALGGYRWLARQLGASAFRDLAAAIGAGG